MAGLPEISITTRALSPTQQFQARVPVGSPHPSAQTYRILTSSRPQFGCPFPSLGLFPLPTPLRSIISRFQSSQVSFLYLPRACRAKTNIQAPYQLSHIHLPFFFQINQKFLLSRPFYYTKPEDCLEINKLNKPRQTNCWLSRSVFFLLNFFYVTYISDIYPLVLVV